ncbi:RTPR, ribonucleoside-triphosphate reductase, adenosylcobalamin-dependent [uncultured Caudovirales phage]|uniref:RTPR, ribonucleoside-triphosphate reductase, adenosylcobalamin-dependent n=1 Tax=uncultured Caudovirales phage TaxID=2100421 RepID=A0A6J5R736_9CAUD|nr:RTPR, ribonucleoside-triphosphate reductase, adenosylcobalamin-dependent [uncultured Caudovirales phage]CAB4193330.1 RTPR, ribonucleoside-triphosphate reductase, adenosylcobalamin-dependent [uncultured Caudovirales phage]
MSKSIQNPYENFIALSRYARWLETENRRETWAETVDRYFDFMVSQLKESHDYTPDAKTLTELRDAVFNRNVMPSMRSVMTAGPALERENVSGYNCAFLPCDNPRSFDEAMYILMCGTGVGFSVEYKYINKLPALPEKLEKSNTIVVVGDSKEGWAKALREFMGLLWAGQIPQIDVSKVRPAGARLKTMGGRSSGPQPLVNLFDFTVQIFKGALGRNLKPIEVHDIMCKIGEVVVVGGVRRSAMISLSNINDIEMAAAKSGNWWESNGQRALSNNSVAYSRKPEMAQFIAEWKSLYDSKSGERGIYNVAAAQKQAAKYGRRDPEIHYGTNPCSEIILRPYQFCNLSEVVLREHDTPDTVAEKVRLATILGTWQSTLTDFKYIRKIWKDNTEEERLLGVSLTGQFGNKFFSGQDGIKKLAEVLDNLREWAVDVNIKEAGKIGIPASAAVTCVKPSGTVSQLVGVSSGMHPWHSEYYIRTVRGAKQDPISKFLIDSGIPVEDDVTKPKETVVFSFPVKAPKHAITRDQLSALEQLEIWLTYQRHWCEHKPSITVSVREEEWMEVGAWVYKHFDEVSGISFLPYSEHTYVQAPYQEVEKEKYEEIVAKMPKVINWEALSMYELEDTTTGTQALACVSGECEIVDINQ